MRTELELELELELVVRVEGEGERLLVPPPSCLRVCLGGRVCGVRGVEASVLAVLIQKAASSRKRVRRYLRHTTYKS